MKSDIGVYYKVWFSLGLYAVPWLLGAMRFVNDHSPAEVYRVRRLRSTAVVLAGTALALLLVLLHVRAVDGDGAVSGAFVGLFAALWSLLLICVALCAYGLYDLAAHLRTIELEHGVGRPVSPWRTLVLFFVVLLAFPYLQAHMNIVERTGA